MLTNKLASINLQYAENVSSNVGTYPNTALFSEVVVTTDKFKTYSSLEELEVDFDDTTDEYAYGEIYFANGGNQLTVVYYDGTSTKAERVTSFAQDDDYKNIIFFAFAEILDADIANVDAILSALTTPNQKIGVYYTNSKSGTLTTDLSEYSIIFYSAKEFGHATIPAYFSKVSLTGTNTLKNVEYRKVYNEDGSNYDYDVSLSTDYDALLLKNYNFVFNVFASSVIGGRVVATGLQISAIFATIAIQLDIQTQVANFIVNNAPYLSPDGVAEIRTVINPILQAYVNNGTLGGARGYNTWLYPNELVTYNNRTYKTVEYGEVLSNGYKIFIPTNISSTDITNKQTPPIYLYLIIQGNIRKVVIGGKVGA